MKRSDAPRRIEGQISIQQIGVETLVYDEQRHQAFCLNRSSSVIWLLADGERTIPQICAEASLQLEMPVSEEFVFFALDKLSSDGLMQAASAPQTAPAISRRALLQRLGAGSATLLPVVATILAPTAAQAYSGCVDCSTSQAARARRRKSTALPSQ